MIDDNGIFHGTDWLKLTVSIDIIGDMIAYYSHLRNECLLNGNQSDLIKYQEEVTRLGRESQLCYDSKNNKEIIIKAFTVYGLFLKELRNKSTDL